MCGGPDRRATGDGVVPPRPPSRLAQRPAAANGDALTMVALISQARVALDIIEAQAVHELRTTLPQTSYDDIGAAPGTSASCSSANGRSSFGLPPRSSRSTVRST